MIGEGTGRFVELIVAAPNTLVGTPNASGEKPALVIVTISSAWAAVAAKQSASAHPVSVMAMTRALDIAIVNIIIPLPPIFMFAVTRLTRASAA
ncbi:MAG TPA: hypothetical protein VNY31_10960 [Solirubrobacteraceae bacterium]|nr:hypothetical protein [Solirubrobacteraceae bacterium]